MTPLSREEAFAAWAPEGVFWSEWAKPIVFAQGERVFEPRPLLDATIPAMPMTFDSTAVVVADLPGADAVLAGLSLAMLGWRPVPLFNATRGPSPAVEVEPIAFAMANGVQKLQWLNLSPAAPPAFLVDALRFGGGAKPRPGSYDNRWVVLPQDFPSGALLASRGVKSAILLQRSSAGLSIADDLRHVLRRWQEHGIRIDLVEIDTKKAQANVNVPAPSRFRRAWYVALALLGLRRSNVGGFGSFVPQDTGRGYYG
jgi:hypothetical protein